MQQVNYRDLRAPIDLVTVTRVPLRPPLNDAQTLRDVIDDLIVPALVRQFLSAGIQRIQSPARNAKIKG